MVRWTTLVIVCVHVQFAPPNFLGMWSMALVLSLPVKYIVIITKMTCLTSGTVILIQNGQTALYEAALHGHVAILRLLLEKEADVNICDKV